MRQRIIDDGYDPNCIGVITNASDVVDDRKYSGDEKNSFRDQYRGWEMANFSSLGTFGHVNDTLHGRLTPSVICSINICLDCSDWRWCVSWGGDCLCGKEGRVKCLSIFRRPRQNDAFKWLANSDGVLVLYKGPKLFGRLYFNQLFDSFGWKAVIANISGWGVKVAEEAS